MLSPRAGIIDGMSFDHKINGDKQTFQNIADIMLTAVLKEGHDCQRIDVVFDIYKEMSIKAGERAMRANHSEILMYNSLRCGTKVVQWREFLRNSSNKTQLIAFINAQWKEPRCRKRLQENMVVMYVTCGITCFRLTSDDTVEVKELCSTQEEADTRMLLHAHHIADHKYQSVIISSMDTDVRILCIAFCKDISVPMYQKSGTDTRTTFVDIRAAAAALGVNMCRSLVGLHSFTGCDSTSAFAGKGKLSALKLLRRNQLYSDLFSELGVEWSVSSELFQKLQEFVCVWYGTKSTDINKSRYQLFCIKKGEIESYQLPPCADSLFKHVLRANYQAAVWKRSLEPQPDIPSPLGLGWTLKHEDGREMMTIDWMDGQPAPQAVLELLSCKCRGKCKAPSCQCISHGLFCTDLCKHGKHCENNEPEDVCVTVEVEDNDYIDNDNV